MAIENYAALASRISAVFWQSLPVARAHFFDAMAGELHIFDPMVQTHRVVSTRFPMQIGEFDTVSIKNCEEVLVVSPGNEEFHIPQVFALQVTDQGDEALLVEKSSPKYRRSNPSLVNVLDRYVIAIGGIIKFGHTSRCDLYSIAHDRWTIFPYLRHCLDWISCLAFNLTHIYAVGGCDGSGGSRHLQRVDLLDTEAGWHDVAYTADSQFFGCDMGVAQDSNTTCLIFGGYKTRMNFRYFHYGGRMQKLGQEFAIGTEFRQRKAVVMHGCVYEFPSEGSRVAKRSLIQGGKWALHKR